MLNGSEIQVTWLIFKFTTDYPCVFEFSNGGFVVKDMDTRQTVMKGTRTGDLYTLDTHHQHAFFSNRHKSAPENVWHWRLGHPQNKVVHFLNKSSAISISSWNKSGAICESCQVGKACRLRFISTRDFSNEPLSVIHSDLWGPVPNLSVTAYRYYVIFIDECTRFTWFYPLLRKSDFFQCFLNFQALVEKQFDKKIKIFQSDGGGKYLDGKFQTYLTRHGILHHISCPHTPS